MSFDLSAQSAEVGRAPLPAIWWLGPVAAVLALAFAWLFYRQVMKNSEGTDKMIEIAQAIRDGAQLRAVPELDPGV